MAVIFAVALLPLALMVGVGIDYTSAADRQAQLDAAADSAALSAVTPTLMAQSTTIAKSTATATFNAQASAIPGVGNATPTVTVATSGAVRTVTVSFTADSQNIFAGIVGMTTLPLSGSSQSTAGLAPNIDFYLLLDDSPSMAIAATQSGINTMVANTSSQGGCHESNPSADNLGNPGGEDNYQLASNLGVTLRIALVSQAAQNLMTTAKSTMASNNAHYRMAIYTFDTAVTKVQALTTNLTTAKNKAGTVDVLEVYDNNNLTSTNSNNDEDTDYDTAMSTLNTAMPNPGSGTNTTGDKPQEVLFFVTDGVEDENVSGGRQQSEMDNGWCDTIKSRGIRIAVLYTTYLPLPTNSWYNTYISGFQANISANLQNCASPGLFYEVQTGGDISAALANLFQLAVQSAYLSQ